MEIGRDIADLLIGHRYWPETIQTSPTSTSFSVTVLLPEMVIVPGVALAGIGLM